MIQAQLQKGKYGRMHIFKSFTYAMGQGQYHFALI